MRGRFMDLTGQRFGKLAVVNLVGKENNRYIWHCKCDCGVEKDIAARYLQEGKSHSCGCIRIIGKPTHGDSTSRLHRIWKGMKDRCNNTNHKDYHLYGARGIKVCQAWNDDYSSFMQWAYANGYNDCLSIDRINNDGDYEPDNCCWADNVTQGNNRRTNRLIEIGGETHTMKEWANITGISYDIIKYRVKTGKTGLDLIKQG